MTSTSAKVPISVLIPAKNEEANLPACLESVARADEIFVVDSQIDRMEANLESLENLRYNLQEQGYDLDKIPYVIQYNKRDLPNVASVEELRTLCNKTNVPDFEGIATTGEGVFDTLKAVAKLVLTELKRGQ